MIDVSELTEAQKATEGFTNTYTEMMKLYNNNPALSRLYSHDPALLIFHERMGSIPFEIVRPKIHHNDSMSRFEGYMDGIKPQLPDCEPRKWRECVCRPKHSAALPMES